MNKKIAYIIDSSWKYSDIDKYIDMTDVYYLPLSIYNSKNELINDDLSIDEFNNVLKNEAKLNTSQTPPGLVFELWNRLIKEYDYIINLPISEELSGQYNSLSNYAKEKEYEGKVFVIKTSGIIITHYVVFNKLKQLVKEMDSIEEVIKSIEDGCKKVVAYILPKSLDRLIAGGRVAPGVAALAKILRIYPILEYRAYIDKKTKARSFKKALSTMVELAIEHTPNSEYIYVAHTLHNSDDLKTLDEILQTMNLKIKYTTGIPNVLSAHIGSDTIAITPDLEKLLWE